MVTALQELLDLPSSRRNQQGSRARDSQRQRLYTAENVAFPGGGPAKGLRTIPECQAFVDKVLGSAWAQRRYGRRAIYVDHKAKGGHYSPGDRTMSLGMWARTQRVILHEIAHELTPRECAWHGQEFAATHLALVRQFIGQEDADRLRAAYVKHRVRHRWALPTPTRPVVTKAERVARAKVRDEREAASARRPERRQWAAETIRAMVKVGHFGPPGRVLRTRALEVARALD